MLSSHALSVQPSDGGCARPAVPATVLALVRRPGLHATSYTRSPATRVAAGSAGLLSTSRMTTVFDGVCAPDGDRTAVDRLGQSAVRVAAEQHGRPYRWGAAGPDAFDAAGLVAFVFRRVGIALPRTADAQYAAVTHLPAAAKRPGDLLFFGGWNGLHHVGVYAGSGLLWHVPRSGDIVRPAPLWTSSYLVGRVV